MTYTHRRREFNYRTNRFQKIKILKFYVMGIEATIKILVAWPK